MGFLKRIFCKHEYRPIEPFYMIDTGMRKARTVKCRKCGKERIEIL